MGPAAAEGTAALAGALSDRALRLAAARALEAIGPAARAARTALEALQHEPNAVVREAALSALRALGPPQGGP
jgi:HEAT repeat protein